MKIHEYQGKQLFQKYGVPVPVGIPAMTAEEAIAAIPKVQQQAGTDVVVVKGDLFQERPQVQYVFIDGAKYEPVIETEPAGRPSESGGVE